MSKIGEKKLVNEINECSIKLWVHMIAWLESANDRIEDLEERIRKLENKEVRK